MNAGELRLLNALMEHFDLGDETDPDAIIGPRRPVDGQTYSYVVIGGGQIITLQVQARAKLLGGLQFDLLGMSKIESSEVRSVSMLSKSRFRVWRQNGTFENFSFDNEQHESVRYALQLMGYSIGLQGK